VRPPTCVPPAPARVAGRTAGADHRVVAKAIAGRGPALRVEAIVVRLGVMTELDAMQKPGMLPAQPAWR
jgi:hypothetical protein